MPPSRAAWHASIGDAVELGVELVDGLGEQVESTVEGFAAAAVLDTARTGPYMWDAAAVGRHTLRDRATDAAGNVHPEVLSPAKVDLLFAALLGVAVLT